MGVFVIVVISLTVAGTALIRSAGNADAPIGGVLILTVVGLLGLPWSLPVFMANDGLDGDVLTAAIYAALAIVNGVLLFWLVRTLNRRRSQPSR